MPEIFDISIWWTSLWLFGHHTFSYKSLSLFPSRILVCVTAFAAYYLFSFWDLHLLSSLSKNNKKCGKIYRHKSTHVSKPTWLLTNHSWKAWKSIYNNHTKMSRFFPQRYKCKNNKLSSKMHKAICIKVQGQTHMWYVLKQIRSNFLNFSLFMWFWIFYSYKTET